MSNRSRLSLPSNDEPLHQHIVSLALHRTRAIVIYFFWVGTGMPGIFTLTEPKWFRLVKYRVFQSSPPKARLVVAGAPWTMRPSFLPYGSIIQMPPVPPQ